jgi:hypothetical protein
MVGWGFFPRARAHPALPVSISRLESQALSPPTPVRPNRRTGGRFMRVGRPTPHNKYVSGYAGFARSTYMAFKRVWPRSEVQRILDRVRVDRPVVATSETSERYRTCALGSDSEESGLMK